MGSHIKCTVENGLKVERLAGMMDRMSSGIRTDIGFWKVWSDDDWPLGTGSVLLQRICRKRNALARG